MLESAPFLSIGQTLLSVLRVMSSKICVFSGIPVMVQLCADCVICDRYCQCPPPRPPPAVWPELSIIRAGSCGHRGADRRTPAPPHSHCLLQSHHHPQELQQMRSNSISHSPYMFYVLQEKKIIITISATSVNMRNKRQIYQR